MKILKIILLTFVFAFFTCKISAADGEKAGEKISAKEYIKVGILQNIKQASIACDKKYYFISNGKKFYLSPGQITVTVENNKAVIADKEYELPVKFVSQKNCFAVNGKIYRGRIIISGSNDGGGNGKSSKSNNISNGGSKNNVINELKTEDYLKGILPKEAVVSWNMQALKTQAVISRTYALKNLGRHTKDGYDICSTVHCQVYGGAGVENKKCNQAIYETAGEVVLYKNALAQTLFHAACGGYTDDPKYVWQWKMETPEYLKGKKDKYCKGNPHDNWKSELEESFIRKKLISAGYKIGTIKKIIPSQTTSGKAAKDVVIIHSKGKTKMNAYTFRLSVDAFKIKSTMFSGIKRKNKKFIFAGKGWGHKAGLCQWGAKAMGDKNISYKKILKYYYPGTTIGKIHYEK